MTTPREIISQALDSAYGPEKAQDIVHDLTAAGFHILSDADLQARDDAVLERAAEKMECMIFLLTIGTPEEGPFTRQDRTRDEVCQQAATAIRSMQGGKP